MSFLNWKIGFEIELMSPRGRSRQDLAELIAQQYDAKVRRVFHPQSELSQVPGTPLFQNLTLGFEVLDKHECLIARCVDDLTLLENLDKTAKPKPGWYRIVSDDSRLLQLVESQADAADSIADVLKPIASLFSTHLEEGPSGMVRIADRTGNPIAIAAPLPGERERPCELITPPIETNHSDRLEILLSAARSIGFTIPVEGATHLHFDATPLCSARVFANLVNLLWTHGENLKRLVGTNPNCRRLGMWDEELLVLVNQSDFCQLSWSDAKTRLAKLELTKYCDFNIKNLIHTIPSKFTFEARIFPSWIYAQPIIEVAALMEAILRYAIEASQISPTASLEWKSESVQEFLKALPLDENYCSIWLSRVTKVISDKKNTYVDEFRLTSAPLDTSHSTLDHSVG
ncbi:amidoligase family protein [Nostoc sp. LEGE 12447]|uniref:amidoligase family protein n=1 Tax=Nostoc sp. LEGE 12447 TaxID=1828640 RepID=UPI001883A38F|nr:amidoligase family protein [Nostoc sp. LEGE 12447]MBE9002080.1 amidoligase family protein [Nostoc sp. LEGE 12447]